jgi:hypothetical protein
MGNTYNPSSWEAEAGDSRLLGQTRLCNETLSQKAKREKRKGKFLHTL